MRRAVVSGDAYSGDAVESYLNAGGPDIHLRLVRLYDHAGRLEDLLAMPRQSDPAGSTSSLLQMVHRLLEIRQMASARDWRGLVTLVDTGGCFELEEAARLLAGHEKAALPLLLEGVEEPERAPWQEVPWGRWYALAFTRLPKAIAALKHEVAREQNYYKLQRLAAALDAAGEAGQAALRDLSVRAGGNLSVVLARNRRGPCSWESRMPYPLPEPPEKEQAPQSLRVARRPDWLRVRRATLGPQPVEVVSRGSPHFRWLLAEPTRLELATSGVTVRCANQLHHGSARLVGGTGFEPVTPCV